MKKRQDVKKIKYLLPTRFSQVSVLSMKPVTYSTTLPICIRAGKGIPRALSSEKETIDDSQGARLYATVPLPRGYCTYRGRGEATSALHTAATSNMN